MLQMLRLALGMSFSAPQDRGITHLVVAPQGICERFVQRHLGRCSCKACCRGLLLRSSMLGELMQVIIRCPGQRSVCGMRRGMGPPQLRNVLQMLCLATRSSFDVIEDWVEATLLLPDLRLSQAVSMLPPPPPPPPTTGR